MKTSALNWIIVIMLVAGVLLGATTTAWSANPMVEQKVLILPPTLNGSPDMAYLRQGLVDMLTTRLAHPGQVAIVATTGLDLSQGAISRARALEMAAKAGADQVVFGSLTILGSSISTDLRMVDVAKGDTRVAFSRSGKDPSALIEHADLFAGEVNKKVFALGQASQSGTPVPAVLPPVPQANQSDTVYQHPEKLLQQPLAEGYGEGGIGAVMIGAGSAVRGPRISGEVQGVAIGDVDGDGRPEAVIAGKSSLWIYKFTNGHFAKMAAIDGRGNYIGVDTSDVNENGTDEIFVTNFDNNSSQLISFVLEYNGREFERRDELMNYYFRAINVPQRGRVLFGQRQGREEVFQSGIFEMVWEGGQYRRGARLKAPRGQHIFGMGLGTLPPSPEQMIFAYNASTQMQVSDNTGKEEWTSSDGYGIVAALVQTVTKDDPTSRDYHYLAGRIEIVDLDGDGVNEAVVLQNKDLSSNVMKRTRLFKQGRLEILKPDELGMATRLRTRYLPKFISDFAIGDLDQDGKPEILTAVVQKTHSIAAKGRTNIYLFNLDGLMTGADREE